MSSDKYKNYPAVYLPDRRWPSKTITHAPMWCSVDLRDGNQAQVTPMNIHEKIEMFQLLVDIGFKEIEVGFPSASQTEYAFTRRLIDDNLIPDDVTIQVLTQAREHLIDKTFEAISGSKKAIVHLYNSTSILQRRVVFRMKKSEIVELAVKATKCIKDNAEKMSGTDVMFEYSPESFTGTEPDFALEICEAVMNVWKPGPGKKGIINLPATVEMSTPNTYADVIEWFCRNIRNRDAVLISLHAHNDRGTAVAATELALMAGADRVEGTLFGNGERTGNVDLVTLALNMFTQGVDPKLDMSNINRIIEVYEKCTKIPLHMRHPYAGELVYTAFSGSHQDAISKGMKKYREEKPDHWEVPYLPIDPSDVGRTYESIIRINSQSGKGGAAYVMEEEYGFVLPKEMQPEFGKMVQAVSDRTGKEVLPGMIFETFEKEYLKSASPVSFKNCHIRRSAGNDESSSAEITTVLTVNNTEKEITGTGNGPIDAFCNAIKKGLSVDFRLLTYHEHALETGSDSMAVSYIQMRDSRDHSIWGAGMDTNIDIASFRAVISALNRS
ncbi:MAG: 2-isopropylmalate synthase [Nitrospirota bacterium]